jgi:predicted dinucleotide-binding enzyme
MVNPNPVANGDHVIFISGNDAGAKAKVEEILKDWFEWKSVIDLGDITTARATEMLLPIWILLMGKYQSPNFNFKIMR